MRRFFFFLVVSTLLSASALRAQGGPPFITDDPGTVENRHWEINVGFIGTHNPGNSSYDVPNFDFNYGLGKRMQLKYEVPLAVATDENNTTRASMGESLLGVKVRFWEHYRAGAPKTDENQNFAIGSYPQASINNPTSAVRRGIVEAGPQYYLPLQMTAKAGWLAFNGEVGRWIGNAHVPDRWGRGLVAGHAFNDRFELYSEIYDLQDINRIGLDPKQRALTLDMGGRQALDKSGHLRLLFMGGRALQAVTRQNSQPSWIAYLGLQIELGPKDAE
jgi:hypothetical protein